MMWLVQFIKPRSTKSNLFTPDEMDTCDSPALSADSESELQQDEDLENERFSDENSRENFVVDNPIKRKRNKSEVTGNLKWNRKKVDIDQAEVEFLSKVGQFVEESTKKKETPKDANDLFGLTLAAELKTLSPRNQIVAKHQINNLMFNLQMDTNNAIQPRNIQQNPLSSPPHPSPLNHFTPLISPPPFVPVGSIHQWKTPDMH